MHWSQMGKTSWLNLKFLICSPSCFFVKVLFRRKLEGILLKRRQLLSRWGESFEVQPFARLSEHHGLPNISPFCKASASSWLRHLNFEMQVHYMWVHKKKNRKQCIQDYFNIINMYTLGFRNITINDKTSTGVMVVCLGPHQIN